MLYLPTEIASAWWRFWNASAGKDSKSLDDYNELTSHMDEEVSMCFDRCMDYLYTNTQHDGRM